MVEEFLYGETLKDIGKRRGYSESRACQVFGEWKKAFAATIVSIALTMTPAFALDAQQVPSKNLRVTWDEPTTNADGTPLDDLASVVIRGAIDSVVIDEVVVPASSPVGGQSMAHTFIDVCQPNTKPQVELNLYALDLVGNESEAAFLPKTIDCLPPGKVK